MVYRMFGIGMPELIVIIVIALLVVGPKKLPELAKSIGKSLSEFRRAADDVTESVKKSLTEDEDKKEGNDFENSLLFGSRGRKNGRESSPSSPEAPSKEQSLKDSSEKT